MKMHELMRELNEQSSSKIVLVVADGLGGLPLEPGGKTELETARTPNLDALAKDGVCGLSVPVLPGVTPGSGPGHLGLFGYDPLQYRIVAVFRGEGLGDHVNDTDPQATGVAPLPAKGQDPASEKTAGLANRFV